MPSGVITAMSRSRPSFLPLSMVKTRDCSVPLVPMICGRRRLVNVFLLEIEHRLQPLALLGVLKQRSLLQPQTIYRLLQIRVLLAHVAQVDVVLPESTKRPILVLCTARSGGEHHAIGPQPDQPHAGCRRSRPRPPLARRTCTASPESAPPAKPAAPAGCDSGRTKDSMKARDQWSVISGQCSAASAKMLRIASMPKTDH